MSYNILVYPNITYQKDLRKDSYIIVIKNAIEVLNKMRNDLNFVMLLPTRSDLLDFPNVEQRIYPQPTYPPSMRIHFDFNNLSTIIKPSDEFDLVYCHLPEHAKQLKIFFDSYTQEAPDFIGYCHWFEVKENAAYPETSFWTNIMGVLEMKEMGVNSIWLKDFIIKRAGERLNTATLAKLNTIIQPHYLGIDDLDMSGEIKKNTILFNHRAGGYTGFNWFLNQMDMLWERRKDFQVFLTTSQADKPYITQSPISNRAEYFRFLKTMMVGVGTFKKYSAWSLSVTDGMSRGLPYLLPRDYCYPEMLGNDYPLYYDKPTDFLPELEKILDNQNIILDARKHLANIMPGFLWENRVPLWFNNWDIFDSLSYNKTTGALEEIVKAINEAHFLTKDQIIKRRNWGRDIKFTNYRRMLRNHPDIKIVKNGYESIHQNKYFNLVPLNKD